MTDLCAHGSAATAVIMGKHTTHSRTTSYFLDYGFLANWVWVNSDEEVSVAAYDRAETGDPIPVTYLPAHPQTHRVGPVNAARLYHQRAKWVLGGLVTFVVLGSLFLFTEQRYRRHRQLLRDGIPVVGRVLDRKAVRGKSITYSVRYGYTPVSAANEISGESTVTPRVYERCLPGAQLTILYDGRHPTRSCPYQALTDVRLA